MSLSRLSRRRFLGGAGMAGLGLAADTPKPDPFAAVKAVLSG